MSFLQKCPKCDAKLPGDGPAGSCPACLLGLAVEIQSETTWTANRFPRAFGDYELLEEIARGGMGVVYRARQVSLDRPVALKMILSDQLATTATVQRFYSEAEAVARLDHPNIVSIYDIGQHLDQHYFSMRLVAGGTLAARRSEFQVTAFDSGRRVSRYQLRVQHQNAATLLCKIARAVHYAHERGILHRDLKPTNILVDETGEPYLTDFGVAKSLEVDIGLSQTGSVLGTPGYMAPEQAAGRSKELTTAADVYSLGAILYELLVGNPPFHAETTLETLRQLAEQEPVSPCAVNPRIDQDLQTICLKCLSKDPKRRYGSAEMLADDLNRWANHEPILARATSRGEKVWRWCRRNPGLAVASGVAAVLLLVVAIGSPTALLRIVRERQRAEQNAAEEGRQRRRAESLARQNRDQLYAARIKLAHQSFEQGNVAGTQDMLTSLHPGGGREDLRGFEWYYLWRLCHSAQRTLIGQNSRVRMVAFSPNGSALASVGDDGVVELWDAATGRKTASLRKHLGPVTSVVFSFDSKWLVSAGVDKTIRVWDLASHQELFSLDGFEEEVTSLAISSGGLLAVGSGELAIGPGSPISRYVRNGNRGLVKVWDLASRQPNAEFNVGKGGVLSMAFSRDGERLAIANPDSTVGIWQARTGRNLHVLTNFTGSVFGVAFSHDGKRLAAVSWYPYDRLGELQVWQEPNFERPSLKLRAPPMTCLAFSPDANTLATGGIDQVVRWWDLENGTERANFKGHTDVIWSIAFAPGKWTVASGSWDRTVKLWDLNDFQAYDILTNAPGHSVAFSPDGSTLACGGSRIVELWDPLEKKQMARLELPNVGDISLAFAPDGKTIAAAGTDGAVYLFDVLKRQLRQRIVGGTNKIWCLAFSSDGRWLATGGGDNVIRVWNMQENHEPAILRGHNSTVSTVAFAPDSRTLISGTWSETRFWNLDDGATLNRISESTPRLAVAPNGKWLASSGPAHGVRIRDLHSREELGRLAGHKDIVNCLAFSGDSKTLVTVSWDGTAKLWSIPSGQLLLTIPSDLGAMWSASFSRDGLSLALGTGSAKGAQVMILRASTAKLP